MYLWLCLHSFWVNIFWKFPAGGANFQWPETWNLDCWTSGGDPGKFWIEISCAVSLQFFLPSHELLQSLDAKIRKWADGKEGNIRSLLSTLQYVSCSTCHKLLPFHVYFSFFSSSINSTGILLSPLWYDDAVASVLGLAGRSSWS